MSVTTLQFCPGEPGFQCVEGILAKGLCKRCYDRRWARDNPEKKAEVARRWREANSERHAENYRRWYEANREQRTSYSRHWREANPGRAAGARRRWYAANREKRAEQHRRWREANSEWQAERVRLWRQANPEKVAEAVRRRRARKAAALTIPFTTEELAARLAFWGNQCWIRGPLCSGEADTVDHVIPLAAGGPHCLSNLRPACRSCNASKGARKVA